MDTRKDITIQRVFDLIGPLLPEGWAELVFYSEYDEGSYSIEFYVKTDGDFVKCYDLPGISIAMLRKTFASVDEVLTAERSKLSKKELWSNMTLVVSGDGKAKADYDYTDLTDSSWEHKKEWKQRYLG